MPYHCAGPSPGHGPDLGSRCSQTVNVVAWDSSSCKEFKTLSARAHHWRTWNSRRGKCPVRSYVKRVTGSMPAGAKWSLVERLQYYRNWTNVTYPLSHNYLYIWEIFFCINSLIFAKMTFFLKLARGAFADESCDIRSAVRYAAHCKTFWDLCDVRCAQSPLPSVQVDLQAVDRLVTTFSDVVEVSLTRIR